jgi:hypothetical protein
VFLSVVRNLSPEVISAPIDAEVRSTLEIYAVLCRTYTTELFRAEIGTPFTASVVPQEVGCLDHWPMVLVGGLKRRRMGGTMRREW